MFSKVRAMNVLGVGLSGGGSQDLASENRVPFWVDDLLLSMHDFARSSLAAMQKNQILAGGAVDDGGCPQRSV
jgi:hypothetical protein